VSIEEFFTSLLGSGLGVALVAFLAKGLIETRLKAAVGLEFDGLLEKFKHGQARALEDAKSKLKREELLFDKLLDAFAAFNALQVEAEPFKLHPDMDWGDAADEIVEGLEETAKSLRDFLRDHGAFLPTEVHDRVVKAWSFADDAKFDEGERREVAERMLSHLRETRNALGGAITAETTYPDQEE